MGRRLSIVLAVTVLTGVAVVGSGCGSRETARPQAAALPPAPTLTPADCRQLVNLPVTFTDAVTGLESDLGTANVVLKQVAHTVPYAIRSDFVVLTAASAKIEATLKGVDLAATTAPSAEVIAKLRKLSREVDTAKVTAASSNVSLWAQSNCSGADIRREG